MRLLDQAVYLDRDGLQPGVRLGRRWHDGCHGARLGRDAAGGAEAADDACKSGGLQGQFSFVAMAPSRGVGVFVSMNEFNVAGFDAMAKTTLELITELTNR